MLRQSHIEHIDFIKGLAAISVILLHTLPISILKDSYAIFHIWQAVPIFIFITFYLGFRTFERTVNIFYGYYSKDRVAKVFQKLWLPLLILAVFESIFFVVLGDKSNAIGSILCIGNGPGSYYIWCYIQIWVLLSLLYTTLKNNGILVGGGIILIISVLGCYIIERYINFRPGFFCFRYLFLSVPAYMYLKGVKIKKIWFLIFVSSVYLYLMLYGEVPKIFDPLLPDGWEAQTCLGFFYPLFLFVLLAKCYEKLKTRKVTKYIIYVGSMSWKVFLMQMVLLGSGVFEFVSAKLFPTSLPLRISFMVIGVLALSLFLATLYKYWLNILLKSHKY